MGLLDTEYNNIKQQFQNVYNHAWTLNPTGGPCSGVTKTNGVFDPWQQEIDFDTNHTNLQTSSQSFSSTFIQKMGLYSVGYNLVDTIVGNISVMLVESTNIIDRITNGDIYTNISSTLSVMATAGSCAVINAYVPQLNTDNSDIASSLDIYAVLDDLEVALQDFISNYGLAANVYTSSSGFFNSTTKFFTQAGISNPYYSNIQGYLNTAFSSQVSGVDDSIILQNLKSDIESMTNLSTILSGLDTRIKNNPLYVP